MKSIPVVLAVLSVVSTALGDYYQLEATADVKLTATYSEENDSVVKGGNYTYSSTIKTFKITTKEVLNELASQDVIPSATGWKIMSISDGETGYYVLRKSKQEDIPIEDLFSFEDEALVSSYKEVRDADDNLVSGSGKWTNLGSGSFSAGEFQMEFSGKSSGTYAYKKAGEDMIPVYGATTVTALGSATYPDTDDIVVEGTFTRGAQKVVKIVE